MYILRLGIYLYSAFNEGGRRYFRPPPGVVYHSPSADSSAREREDRVRASEWDVRARTDEVNSYFCDICNCERKLPDFLRRLSRLSCASPRPRFSSSRSTRLCASLCRATAFDPSLTQRPSSLFPVDVRLSGPGRSALCKISYDCAS